MPSTEVPEEVLAAVDRRLAGCLKCRGPDADDQARADGVRYWFLAALLEEEYQQLHPAEWYRAARWRLALTLARPMTCPRCGTKLELHSTVMEERPMPRPGGALVVARETARSRRADHRGQVEVQMPTGERCRGDAVFELRVTLKGVTPQIWRRLQVRGDTRLNRLHEILQIAMGWTEDHLHEFEVSDQTYGPVPEPADSETVADERTVRLADVVHRTPARFAYLYNFSADWWHEIEVERLVSPKPGEHYPACLDGARNRVPEDCSGAAEYNDLLAVLANPRHADYADRKAWVGPDYEPDVFHLAAVNQALRKLRAG